MNNSYSKERSLAASQALIVMGDPPRMVLTVLVEAFGVADARQYVERQLIPYFVVCGVRVEGSSGDGLQHPRLDDPRGSPDDPQPHSA